MKKSNKNYEEDNNIYYNKITKKDSTSNLIIIDIKTNKKTSNKFELINNSKKSSVMSKYTKSRSKSITKSIHAIHDKEFEKMMQEYTEDLKNILFIPEKISFSDHSTSSEYFSENDSDELAIKEKESKEKLIGKKRKKLKNKSLK